MTITADRDDYVTSAISSVIGVLVFGGAALYEPSNLTNLGIWVFGATTATAFWTVYTLFRYERRGEDG